VTTSFARRERQALCKTALATDPDAPTLCDGWTVRDLICHLLVRERMPWTVPGQVVPAWSGLVDRAMASLAREPFPQLVGRLADTRRTAFAIGGVDRLINTLEFLVHHEDIRRAQPGWEPRTLDADDERELWRRLSALGRMLVRPAGVPVVITDGARTATLRRGPGAVTVSGPVSELALLLFGRHELGPLSFDGPPDAVARLRGASMGL
jgi:uncharacterized protein (TIGR03085 family)